MDIFGDLPTWAVLLLGIFCAAILMMLNLGWRSQPSQSSLALAQSR